MACLVKMIESRFVSLNPFLQYMFLKLHEIEDGEKKDFILETLLRKFKYEAIEARKIFDRFDMLGSSIVVLGIFDKITKVKPEEINIPIPFKLAGMHVAYKKKLIGLFLKIPLMKVVELKVMREGLLKIL